MVGLDSKDPSRSAKVGRARDQGRRAVISRHTDILEDEGTDQERQVVLRAASAVAAVSKHVTALAHTQRRIAQVQLCQADIEIISMIPA